MIALPLAVLTLQLLTPPAGLPPPTLRLIHVDARAAVHADVSENAGASRVALIIPFDTSIQPYWLGVDVDCAAGTVLTPWRQSAVGLSGHGREPLSGAVPQSLHDAGAGPAVGRQVCRGETLFPETAPVGDADAAMSEAYDLPFLVRERPDIYRRTGDLAESLEFLGLAADDFGWFVDPRSAREVDGGVEIQTLRIAGRSFEEIPGARYVWSRMRFSCDTPTGRILTAFAYDDGNQPISPAGAEVDLPPFSPNSPLDIARRFACSPGDPPDSQTVPGLWSALIGVRDHFAPGGPAENGRQDR